MKELAREIGRVRGGGTKSRVDLARQEQAHAARNAPWEATAQIDYK